MTQKKNRYIRKKIKTNKKTYKKKGGDVFKRRKRISAQNTSNCMMFNNVDLCLKKLKNSLDSSNKHSFMKAEKYIKNIINSNTNNALLKKNRMNKVLQDLCIKIKLNKVSKKTRRNHQKFINTWDKIERSCKINKNYQLNKKNNNNNNNNNNLNYTNLGNMELNYRAMNEARYKAKAKAKLKKNVWVAHKYL